MKPTTCPAQRVIEVMSCPWCKGRGGFDTHGNPCGDNPRRKSVCARCALESIDFARETHGAGDPSRGRVPTDDPRDVLYPGRMSAHPGPDEEIF